MTKIPFTPGERIFGYLRDSGHEDQELSIEQQESALRKWAKEHNLVITRIYKDEAKRGSSVVKRDELQAMMYAFRHECPERGVVVWKYNRFARSVDNAQFFRAEIRTLGYIFYSMNDKVPEGAMGRLFEAAIDFKDEQYLEDLSLDVKRGLHSLVERYGCVPGSHPRGFMREPLPPIRNERTGELRSLHKWIPDPTLAPLVLRAFEMRAEGRPLREILSATGLYKTTNCFTTFFTNKLYKGVLEFGDMVIEDYCEPIVPPELWEKVNVIRKSTRPGNSIHDPRRVNSSYLLSGLIACQSCGALLVGHRIKQWHYYACPHRKIANDCRAPHIPKEKIERGVLSAIEETFTLETLVYLQGQIAHRIQTDQRDAQSARIQLDRELDSVSKKIANLTNAIAAHGHSESMLTALAALESEQAQLKIQLEDAKEIVRIQHRKPPDLKQIHQHIQHIVNDGTFEEKQTLIRAFTTRIIASRQDKEIRAMLYYLPIKILTRNEGGLGNQAVPPREVRGESLIEISVV